MEDSKKKLNEDTIRIIEFGILSRERQNVKTNKVKDLDMIKDIVNVIKTEVDREE